MAPKRRGGRTAPQAKRGRAGDSRQHLEADAGDVSEPPLAVANHAHRRIRFHRSEVARVTCRIPCQKKHKHSIGVTSAEELPWTIIYKRRKHKLRSTTRRLMKHLRSVLDTSDLPAALEALSDARVEALRGFMVQKYFVRDFGLLLKPIQEAARLSATEMVEALDETERKLRGDDLLKVNDDTTRVSQITT